MRLKKWIMDSNERYDSLDSGKRLLLMIAFGVLFIIFNLLIQPYDGISIIVMVLLLLTWRLSPMFFDKNVNRKLYKRAKRL